MADPVWRWFDATYEALARGQVDLAAGGEAALSSVEPQDSDREVAVLDAPMLLKASEGDAGLKDRATLSAITGAAGNTEADFTNYARKTGADGDGDGRCGERPGGPVDPESDVDGGGRRDEQHAGEGDRLLPGRRGGRVPCPAGGAWTSR
jgi:hypothetical protein